MNKLFLLSAFLFLLIAACKEQNDNNNLMPELASCDSAAILYYHEPDKPRFFNMAKVYDKKIITAIAENVNGKLITDKNSCLTQGKIYGYGKGDAVYVVYFNHTPGCKTISFIKTAEKYFVKMNEDTKKLLDDLEKIATGPQSKN